MQDPGRLALFGEYLEMSKLIAGVLMIFRVKQKKPVCIEIEQKIEIEK